MTNLARDVRDDLAGLEDTVKRVNRVRNNPRQTLTGVGMVRTRTPSNHPEMRTRTFVTLHCLRNSTATLSWNTTDHSRSEIKFPASTESAGTSTQRARVSASPSRHPGSPRTIFK